MYPGFRNPERAILHALYPVTGLLKKNLLHRLSTQKHPYSEAAIRACLQTMHKNGIISYINGEVFLTAKGAAKHERFRENQRVK